MGVFDTAVPQIINLVTNGQGNGQVSNPMPSNPGQATKGSNYPTFDPGTSHLPSGNKSG